MRYFDEAFFHPAERHASVEALLPEAGADIEMPSAMWKPTSDGFLVLSAQCPQAAKER